MIYADIWEFRRRRLVRYWQHRLREYSADVETVGCREYSADILTGMCIGVSKGIDSVYVMETRIDIGKCVWRGFGIYCDRIDAYVSIDEFSYKSKESSQWNICCNKYKLGKNGKEIEHDV